MTEKKEGQDASRQVPRSQEVGRERFSLTTYILRNMAERNRIGWRSIRSDIPVAVGAAVAGLAVYAVTEGMAIQKDVMVYALGGAVVANLALRLRRRIMHQR